MILKASQRAGGKHLAAHLLNHRDNDHVTVHEIRGFMSSDLMGAFNETYAISRGTKCKQYLFSVSLSPPEDADVAIHTFEAAISEIERRNKLINQPRAIVFHEKQGRSHAHCVWSRIDTNTMTAVNLSHFKLKLRDLSRELFLENDWQLPRGLMNSEAKDPLNFSLTEWQQALRARADPKELKAMFGECWAASRSRQDFESILQEYGFFLAKGDQRGFVCVDWRGEVYSLSRWTRRSTKELSAKLGSAHNLQNVDSANKKAAATRSVRETEYRSALKSQLAELRSRFIVERNDLVSRHRRERRALRETQSDRTIKMRKANQAKLPTGLKALWFRVTGQYHHVVDQTRLETAREREAQSRDARRLIATQLCERNQLDQRYRQQTTDLQTKVTSLSINPQIQPRRQNR